MSLFVNWASKQFETYLTANYLIVVRYVAAATIISCGTPLFAEDYIPPGDSSTVETTEDISSENSELEATSVQSMDVTEIQSLDTFEELLIAEQITIFERPSDPFVWKEIDICSLVSCNGKERTGLRAQLWDQEWDILPPPMSESQYREIQSNCADGSPQLYASRTEFYPGVEAKFVHNLNSLLPGSTIPQQLIFVPPLDPFDPLSIPPVIGYRVQHPCYSDEDGNNGATVLVNLEFLVRDIARRENIIFPDAIFRIRMGIIDLLGLSNRNRGRVLIGDRFFPPAPEDTPVSLDAANEIPLEETQAAETE